MVRSWVLDHETELWRSDDGLVVSEEVARTIERDIGPLNDVVDEHDSLRALLGCGWSPEANRLALRIVEALRP